MKRIIPLALCFILTALLCAPLGVLAEPLWGAGTGTSESDAFIISDAAGLQLLADNVNAGTTYAGSYFKLGADIDLNGISWPKIGYRTDAAIIQKFSGTFDGANFKIKNLNVANTDATNTTAGLFGVVAGDATTKAVVKNVIIDSGSVYSNKWSGGVVGYAEYATITNCVNNATVTGKKYDYTAGIVGQLTSGDISNCTNYGAVNATVSTCVSTAGIVGYLASSTAANCVNYGAINGTGSKGCIGGIAGKLNTVTITDCANKADISASSLTGGYVGGIAGYITAATSTILHCINYNAIICTAKTSYTYRMGGILGFADFKGSITECINKGTLPSNTYASDVGGIAGKITQSTNYFVVQDCYNIGGGGNAGIVASSSQHTQIKNSYSIGANPYAIYSYTDTSNCSYTNNYFLDSITGWKQNGSAYTSTATAKTAVQLADSSVATLLNASRTIWTQGENYPDLTYFYNATSSASITSATATDVSFNVALESTSTGVVYVALYNDTQMVVVKQVNASDKSVSFGNVGTVTKAKIYVWDSLNTLKPLCASDSLAI